MVVAKIVILREERNEKEFSIQRESFSLRRSPFLQI
jgi:hypothetical protein